MKKYLGFLWIVISLSTVYSQSQIDLDHYRPLRSSGELPQEFTRAYQDRWIAWWKREQPLKQKKVTTSKNQEYFEMQSALYTDRLLRSGNIIYNDTLSGYLNQVMHTVLDANDLPHNVRVFLYNTSEVNAFAFDKNVIVVTTGLLSQVNTEAELAYTLCHEYIHFRDKHSYEEHLQAQKMRALIYNTRLLRDVDKQLLESRFSKTQEQSADVKGLDLLKNTNYTLEAAGSLMEVFRFCELPFDEVAFNKSFLESPYLKIPGAYFLEEVSPVIIDMEKDLKDSKYSSHPNLNARIETINENLEDVNNSGRVEFIHSKSAFLFCRKIARYETVHLNLVEQNYADAFYGAYMLLQEDPENEYLQSIVAKALYSLATFGNDKRLSRVLPKYEKSAGNIQNIYFMFDQISRLELNVVALNYSWRVHKKFPGNAEVDSICTELFIQLGKVHDIGPSYFKSEYDKVTAKDTATVTTDSTETKTSKLKRKTNKTRKKSESTSVDSTQYAFIDLIQEPDFKQRLKQAWNRRNEVEDQEIEELTALFDKSASKLRRRINNKGKLDHDDEQIKKLIIFDPMYLRIRYRDKGTDIEYLTETNPNHIEKILKPVCRATGVETVLLAGNKIDAGDVEKLNDLMEIGNYIDIKQVPPKLRLLPVDQSNLSDITDRYETKYVGKFEVVCLRTKPQTIKTVSNVLCTFLAPMYFPYGIMRLAQSSYQFVVVLEVYDMETGRKVKTLVEDFERRDQKDYMTSALYQIFSQLNSKQ